MAELFGILARVLATLVIDIFKNNCFCFGHVSLQQNTQDGLFIPNGLGG